MSPSRLWLGDLARRGTDWASPHPLAGYWLPALACIGLVALAVALRVRAERDGRAGRPLWGAAMAALTLLALLVLRWPTLAPYEANPDESWVIAGAVTLTAGGIYWETVDLLTHGPLAALPLVGAARLGVPLEYGSARVVGLLLLWTSMLSVYGVLRRLTSEPSAGAALLCALLSAGFLVDPDFIAYNGELPTLALLGLGGYTVCRLATGVPGRGSPWALGAGFLLALVPLAKLQGAPLAALLWLLAVAALVAAARASRRFPWKPALALLLGSALPPAWLLAYLWRTGLFEPFWVSYILGNLSYADRWPMSLAERLGNLGKLVRRFGLQESFLLGLVLWSLLAAVSLRRRLAELDGRRRAALAASAALLLASVYSIYRPGNAFDHYMLFLYPSAIFAAGAVLEAGRRLLPPGLERRLFTLVFLVVGLGIAGGRAVGRGNQVLDNPLLAAPDAGGLAVARVVNRYALPGEPLLVWGWMPRYLVLSGMIQVCPEPSPVYEMQGKEFYQERLRRRLDAVEAPVFVDGVGPGAFGFRDRETWGHESYPWLAGRIRDRYVQVADVGGARVLVRSDRLEAARMADLDGDGLADVLRLGYDSPWADGRVLGALSGSEAPGTFRCWGDFPVVDAARTTAAGDFDGDGLDDLASWADGAVSVALSRPAGLTPPERWLDPRRLGRPATVLAGDVDGDGRSDLVLVKAGGGGARVAPSRGDGFAEPRAWLDAMPGTYRFLLADLDGDGRKDLVGLGDPGAGRGGQVWVALSRGTGFGRPGRWHDFFAVEPGQVVRAGDLDGDGRDDLLTFLEPPDGALYVVRSLGDRLGPNELVPGGPYRVRRDDVPLVGDVDGDGRADVLILGEAGPRRVSAP